MNDFPKRSPADDLALAHDAMLVTAWRNGDRNAGEALIERHFAAVYRFFAGKLRDDATDLTQCTFAKLTEHIDALQCATSFRAYLFTLARNLLYSHLRSKSRRPQNFDPVTTSLAAIQTSPSEAAARNDALYILHLAMQRLPLDLHILLEFHYWHGLTMREIAQVLEVPVGTAKSRMGRAMAQLRALVDEALRERGQSRSQAAAMMQLLAQSAAFEPISD